MTDPLDPGTDVGLYVHWPYCARICPYCDFNVVRDRGRTDEQDRLVEAILADLAAQRALTVTRATTPSSSGATTIAWMAAISRSLSCVTCGLMIVPAWILAEVNRTHPICSMH